MKNPKHLLHAAQHNALYLVLFLTYFILNDHANVEHIDAKSPANADVENVVQAEKRTDGDSIPPAPDLGQSTNRFWTKIIYLRYYIPVMAFSTWLYLYRTMLWKKFNSNSDLSGTWLGLSQYSIPDDASKTAALLLMLLTPLSLAQLLLARSRETRSLPLSSVDAEDLRR